MPPRARSDHSPRAQAGGYRKGEATRARMLDAAVEAFGRDGFAGVTTRQIADEAEASLPTLNYYFGDKAGLYLACAHEIADRYERAMGEVAREVVDALRAPMDPGVARERLKQLFAALIEFLFARDDTKTWALFIQREIANPGEAYEVLYSRVWAPGVEISAALISRALGGAQTTTDARVRAILLISSLTAFSSGRLVVTRVLDLPPQAHAAAVAAIIEQDIERLGRG